MSRFFWQKSMTISDSSALFDAFAHMLTVYRDPDDSKVLKIEKQQLLTEKGQAIFMRHLDPLLSSPKCDVFAVCRESKDKNWKKYALLSQKSPLLELYSDASLRLHEEAAQEGIALKVRHFSTPLEKGYLFPFAYYGDLYQMLENAEQLTEEAKQNIAEKLIELVASLHRIDIAHQDLKLENILVDLTKEGELRFYLHNFSRATKEETSTLVCGSEAYMPLDHMLMTVFRPKLRDAFSLGVILFSLFTKKMWKDQKDPLLIEREKQPLLHPISIQSEYRQILLSHRDQIPSRMRPILEGFLNVHPFDRLSIESAVSCLKKGAF